MSSKEASYKPLIPSTSKTNTPFIIPSAQFFGTHFQQTILPSNSNPMFRKTTGGTMEKQQEILTYKYNAKRDEPEQPTSLHHPPTKKQKTEHLSSNRFQCAFCGKLEGIQASFSRQIKISHNTLDWYTSYAKTIQMDNKALVEGAMICDYCYNACFEWRKKNGTVNTRGKVPRKRINFSEEEVDIMKKKMAEIYQQKGDIDVNNDFEQVHKAYRDAYPTIKRTSQTIKQRFSLEIRKFLQQMNQQAGSTKEQPMDDTVVKNEEESSDEAELDLNITSDDERDDELLKQPTQGNNTSFATISPSTQQNYKIG